MTFRTDTLDNYLFDKMNADDPDKVQRWLAEYAEIERRMFERQEMVRKYRRCRIHGPGATGRQIYGRACWGFGMTCSLCRREWSKKHNGIPWESAEQVRVREAAEHAQMVAAIEAMPPAEFYPAWDALRVIRHEQTKRYSYEWSPDEFGVVQQYGSGTADGRRYSAMRERVRRERDEFQARRLQEVTA